MPQGLFLGGQHPQFHIEARGRNVQRRVQRPVAAMDVLPVQIRAGEVEGAALAGFAAFRRPVLGMDAAHPRFPARGRDQQSVAHPHRTAVNGAGHHRADARQGETAIHRQPEPFAACERGSGARLRADIGGDRRFPRR